MIRLDVSTSYELAQRFQISGEATPLNVTEALPNPLLDPGDGLFGLIFRSGVLYRDTVCYSTTTLPNSCRDDHSMS